MKVNQAPPSKWTSFRLGDILTVIRGASPRPKGDPRFFGGSIPWITIRDITQEKSRFLQKTREGVTPDGAERSRLLPAGTLILSNSGTVCVPKFLATEGCIHDGFVAFPDIPDNLDPTFLYEYFNWIRPAVINENRQGMTQVNLNTAIVSDLRIPLPPFSEQRRIVAAIDEHLSRLDEAVMLLERVQRNLKRYRASVLKAAVEGRLVPTEAELARAEGRDYEPASVLLERILEERRRRAKESRHTGKYNEPTGPDISTLPILPEGWCWATVEQLSTKVADGVHKKPNYAESGIPFVTVKNLTAGPGISFDQLNLITLEDHKHFILRTNPEQGDILITKDGTLGVVRAVKTEKIFSIFVSVALVKPVLYQMTDYLEIAFSSPSVQSQMAPKGSGLQHIHLEDLRKDCIPLAPLCEQMRIAVEAQRQLSLIDELDEIAHVGISRSAHLRQSILKHAFEGKLVDQDPADEPASILLERIRAERAATATKAKPRTLRRKA
jgi:type I restriction enzyme, S subunit